MIEAISAAESSRPESSRKWIIIFGFIGLLVGAVFYFYFLPNRQAKVRLQQLGSSGFPVTLSDADHYYPAVPFNENATVLISEGFRLLDNQELLSSKIVAPSRKKSLPLESRQLLEETVARGAPALEWIGKGLAFEKSRYPLDLRMGASTLIPHVNKIRQATMLYEAESFLRIEQGQGEMAFRSVTNALRLAASLNTEPLLISHLYRISCLETTLSSLERLLTRIKLTETQLLKLGQLLVAAEASNQEAVKRCFIGERCFGIELFQMSPTRAASVYDGLSVNGVQLGNKFSLWAYELSGLRGKDFIFYLESMEDFISAASLPYPESLRAAREVDDRIQKEMHSGWGTMLSTMMLPSFSTTIEKFALSQARLRAAEISLAVERYRLNHADQLPSSLAQLSPETVAQIPADPFTGGEFKRQLLPEGGYVIYSVGPDLNDDNGLDRRTTAKRKDKAIDVTFTVER